MAGVAIGLRGVRDGHPATFGPSAARADSPALRWWRRKIKGLCALGKACHWPVTHTFWCLARFCRRKCTRTLELTLPSKAPPLPINFRNSALGVRRPDRTGIGRENHKGTPNRSSVGARFHAHRLSRRVTRWCVPSASKTTIFVSESPAKHL